MALRRLFAKFRTEPVNMVAFTSDRPPLYFRRPPVWITWAYGIIAIDALATISSMDMVWNYWTERVEQPEAAAKAEKGKTSDEVEWIPRSVWMRGGLSFSYLLIGSVVAAALLAARSRFVRTLHITPAILPGTKDSQKIQRQVFIQTLPMQPFSAAKSSNQGMLFPMEKCLLRRGRDDTELFVQALGQRGQWFLNLKRCEIDGLAMKTTIDAKNSIISAWKPGPLFGLDEYIGSPNGKWKNGPLAEMGKKGKKSTVAI